jgi:ABC-type transport system involved in cytochrome bd biosynthesis fused ATPase/permease subunit
MRFESGKVKFVAVDEPSSALDAEGELKLFERLIAAREGKTMVFVTHRFGHLTKHADQIMCVFILKETFFVCWHSNIKESFYYF